MTSKHPIQYCSILVGFLILAHVASCVEFNKSMDNPNSKIHQPSMPDSNKSNRLSFRWYSSNDQANLKGVALIIPGLNLLPEKMEPIISILTEIGIEVLNLSLTGQGNIININKINSTAVDQLEAFKTVTYEMWRHETFMAYEMAREKSNNKKVPLVFVGFSLGGLMGADLLASQPDVSFDKMVLFAPALKIRPRNNIIKILSWFPRLVIPSFSPKSYRANSGTPIAAYNSMFEALSHFEKHISAKINIPTLVFIKTDDEFVCLSCIETLVKDKELDQWELHVLEDNKTVTTSSFHHLIVDEQSVGNELWREIKELTIKHLKN